MQNGLPALLNAVAVHALTPQQATAYANGYGLGNVNTAPQRKRAIGRFIGCTVAV
jgi:hypothetical protein